MIKMIKRNMSKITTTLAVVYGVKLSVQFLMVICSANSFQKQATINVLKLIKSIILV
jgi:hypothetical protein